MWEFGLPRRPRRAGHVLTATIAAAGVSRTKHENKAKLLCSPLVRAFECAAVLLGDVCGHGDSRMVALPRERGGGLAWTHLPRPAGTELDLSALGSASAAMGTPSTAGRRSQLGLRGGIRLAGYRNRRCGVILGGHEALGRKGPRWRPRIGGVWPFLGRPGRPPGDSGKGAGMSEQGQDRLSCLGHGCREHGMNKLDIVGRVADRMGAQQVHGPKVPWIPCFGAISEPLAREETVRIVGFGSFATRCQSARTGRNPRTGESVLITASKAPSFKAGKALRDALNSGGKRATADAADDRNAGQRGPWGSGAELDVVDWPGGRGTGLGPARTGEPLGAMGRAAGGRWRGAFGGGTSRRRS